MNLEALVQALQHQRDQLANQNAELLANSLVMQKEIAELRKKVDDLTKEV